MKEYHVTNQPVATLGLTTYLFGLAFGCLALAPLSELYGRRPIYLVSLGVFALLILPCAMPSSLAEIIIVRFFGYVFSLSLFLSLFPGVLRCRMMRRL